MHSLRSRWLFVGTVALLHLGAFSVLLHGVSSWFVYIVLGVPALVLTVAAAVLRQESTAPTRIGTLVVGGIILWWPAILGLGLVTGLRYPGIDWAIPIGATIAILHVVTRDGRHVRPTWFAPGRFDLVSVILGVATALLAGLALWLWSRTGSPTIEFQRQQLQQLPSGLLVPAALGFAITNALAEEFVYRGIIREGLRTMTGPVTEVLITSALFGVAHLSGFPSGPVGMAMVFVWGVSLGIIRNRTEGMIGPVLVHIAADLVIFGIVATL